MPMPTEQTMWGAVVLVAALGGCGTEDQAADVPAVEGCEHLQEGPFAELTATAAASDAPWMTDEHTAYQVTLSEGASGYVGFVAVPVRDAGDVYVYSDRPEPMVVRDDQGSPVAAEAEATEVSACTEVARESLFELEVGTYTVELGPAYAGTATLVFFSAGSGHEH